MQFLMVKEVYLNKSIAVRALLDSRSQKYYISKDCAEILSLIIKTGEDVIVHNLFGQTYETLKVVHQWLPVLKKKILSDVGELFKK